MVEKKTQHLAVLQQARKNLELSEFSDVERENLVKLLDLLIRAIQEHSNPINLKSETDLLAENLVSSAGMLSLAKDQAEELDALKKLSLNLTTNLDLSTVLDAVIFDAMQLVPTTRTAHIFLYRNKKLVFGSAVDPTGKQDRPFSRPRKNGLTYTVARQGELIIVNDMKDHPLYKDAPSTWHGSIIGIPLKKGEEVVGVMSLSKNNVGGFTPSEIRLLKLLADQAAVAIYNANLLQTLSHKAYSDTITNLPNRRALDERLEAEIVNARRTNTSFAVVMMDLDGFKSVNDTHGHEVGDLVLRAVSNVIAVGIRSTDFLARYGGDELTLIVSESDIKTTKLVTDKILQNLAKFSYRAPNGSQIKVGVSGGIAIFPIHGLTSPALLRAADAALYDAKKHYRGTFVVAIAPTGYLNPFALDQKESGN